MLNENAKKWVAALRSGKYRQGKNALCYQGKFCCLGVACELAIEAGVPGVTKQPVHSEDGVGYRDEIVGQVRHGLLPEAVRRWLGLNSIGGTYRTSSLTVQNDAFMDFNGIADLIESEPEGLFEYA